MNRTKKIVLTLAIAAPLLAGLVMLLKFEKLRQSGPAPQSASQAAPSNPAHEMAALEVELKKNPNHTPILLRMAELKRETGKPDEAVEWLRKAAESNDANGAEAGLELGRALFESGDTQGGIAATKALLQKQPQNVDALYNLGAMYGNTGDDASAREYFQRALAAGPTTESGKKAAAGLEVLAKGQANPHNAAVHR